MTQLSREPIAEIIEGLEQLANRGIQSVHIDMAIAGMRRLLAAEAQEPVGIVRYVNALGGRTGIHVSLYAINLPEGTELYAAPRPVAVPDVGEFNIFTQAGGVKVAVKDGVTKNHLFGMGWNACRAAMLNAEPVSQPYTLPQWIPCSERMPEESGRYWCYVEEQNSLGKSHYQWNCSWNGDVWSDKALTGRVTHWMPLPAAPQEPTK